MSRVSAATSCASKVKVKVLPTPGVLLARQSRPSSSCARLRPIDKPEAGAAGASAELGLLERLEDARDVGRVDARARVGDHDFDQPRALGHARAPRRAPARRPRS